MLIALLAAATTATTPAPLNFDTKGNMSVSFGVNIFSAPSLPSQVPAAPAAASVFPTMGVVGLSYFVADGTAVRAELSFDAILSSGGGPATLSLGVGARMYQLKRERVAVFFQPSVVLARYRVSATDGAEALTFAGGIGAEYLFTDRFSVGGVLSAAFVIGNIGGPTGSSAITEITTATSGLFASLYF
jgi:hypothetical protein